MKMNFVLISFLFFSSACSILKPQGSVISTQASATQEAKITKKPRGMVVDLALKHPVSVSLLNLDTQKERTLELRPGMELYDLAQGSWQVMGFTLEDRHFETVLSAESFVFQVKKKKETYAGSWIFQCPRIGPEFNSLLKTYKFFTRYQFQKSSVLCEMVVGNDFANVKKIRKTPLVLGL